MPTKPRIPRDQLEPGGCLCDHCIGKCCRYFSFPIATPANWDDYDAIRRYLDGGPTLVYVDKGTWYLVVMTRCRYLTREDRCGIYLNRPKICREYTADECEYDDDWLFEKVFETAGQLDEYAEALLPARRRPPGPEPEGAGRYLVVPIETPTTWDDYDAVRWYLAHGRTLVYVEDGDWHLVVMTGCRHVPGDDRREKVFETPEQLWEHAEALLPPRRRKGPSGPSIAFVTLEAPGREP